MQRLLHTHLALVVRRIALVYVVLMLCRVAFWVVNAASLGIPTWGEWGSLVAGALTFDTASIVYADGLFILLSLLPLQVRGERWYRRMLYSYYMVVNSLLVVAVNLADGVYFRYAQKRFTADEIFFADNSNSLQLIGKFAVENWGLLLVGAALIALLAWGYGRKAHAESVFSTGWSYYVGNTLIFIAAAGLCIAGMRGGFTRATRPITLSNATLYTPDSGRANALLSNPFCILRTVGSSGKIKYKKYFDDAELLRRFDPVHRPSATAPADSLTTDTLSRERLLADSLVRSLKGRNIVVFIMESMSAEHSAYLRPDLYTERPVKGFTPFLDSLMGVSLTFKQMYANGTRSIQAMPAILGSIPSFKTPFVLMPQALGESRQLPAILASLGYSTAFMCGSERGSMGFGAYARSAGVERLISREEYEARHGTDDFDGYWGIWDDKFLQFAGEEFSAMQQPFFGALFTLSSHHPFVVPERFDRSLPEGYTRIHRGAAYADLSMRMFYERYRHEAWFSRTIFVFVADHVSSEKFAPESNTYPANMHIIGFIHTPDGALQGQINAVTQQLDIMPTLLGIAGNTEPYFAFGRDILHEPDRPQWAVNYDGQFRAVTCQALLSFDDQTEQITPRFQGAAPAAELLNDFQALVQQYYTRIERKCYTVHD